MAWVACLEKLPRWKSLFELGFELGMHQVAAMLYFPTFGIHRI